MIKENDLPDGWKIQELRDVCFSKGEYGSGARAVEYDSKKPRYIRITDIDENGCLKNKNIVSPSIIEEKYILEDGDLLFARSGSVGKTYLYNQNDGFCQYAGYLIRFKPNSKIIDSNYLQYLTKTPYYWNWINSKKNAVTIHNINAKKYAELKIPLPPLQTQKKIVAILEKAERLKEWRKEADELTDEFLKSIFLEMFGDPMRNPKGWKKQKFKNIVNEFRYGSSNKSTETGYPILRIPNVVGNVINLHDLKYSKVTPNEYEKLKLFEGDILFVRTNGNQNYVGRCAIVDKIHVNFIYASYLIRARINKEIILPEYLKNYLYTEYAKQLVKSRTRTSAGQYNINTVGLGLIDILTPPLPLQHKFASIIQQVEQLREHQSQSRQQIDDLFNVLIQKAFKGELM